MEQLIKMLADVLENTADKLRQGTSTISKDELLDIMDILSEGDKTQLLSKEKACRFMQMSRASFDSYIRMGFIPKGKKQAGLKELTWSLLDLEKAKIELDKR